MRGAPLFLQLFVSGIGIIPACAGSTLTAMPAYAGIGDHPRMCGEHGQGPVRRRPEAGSSPHVRGALDVGDENRRTFGIIPACAGSTPVQARRGLHVRDHPRMCGEHRLGFGDVGGPPGIIPACAGSTPGTCGRATSWWDHPRMCGEHWSSASRTTTS